MEQRSLFLWGTLIGLVLVALLTHRQATLLPSEAPPDSKTGWMDRYIRPIAYANPPVQSDSITNAEAFRAIGRLHDLQAHLAEAQAANEQNRITRLLDTAMRALHRLVARPGLAERPRFRTIFRSLTAEYEARYGIPDTLRLPSGAIYDQRRQWFTALNEAPPLQLDEVLPTELQLTNTEVRLPLNERVQSSIAFLLRTETRNLHPWLQRSATYFPMIEHILAEENVPDELKYLALVESGLNPYAYSHARAAGLWQFTAATGRRYGLTIDPWVDERLDPEKSTRAAARHLRDLYDLFGDWHLAMAGYNCSPHIVMRAIDKARDRLGHDPTFWDIYPNLPEETRNYVPLFIATAILVSNPTTFGIERVSPGPRYAFDHVPVTGAHTVSTLAALAEVDVKTIKSLNPELRGHRLPPADGPYYIRLPYGTYSTFTANYDTLAPSKKTPSTTHVVQTGETPAQIAQRYHVDRPALLRANDMQPGDVRVGQPLMIPTAQYLSNAPITRETDARPLRVRYGNRAIRPLTQHPAPDLAAITPDPPDS